VGIPITFYQSAKRDFSFASDSARSMDGGRMPLMMRIEPTERRGTLLASNNARTASKPVMVGLCIGESCYVFTTEPKLGRR
jgi:hypothetical protein